MSTHCRAGDCHAGMIGTRTIIESEWNAEIVKFNAVIEDWNEKTKRFAIPHPGFSNRFIHCPQCGKKVVRVMDNKLSELSKPVAWAFKDANDVEHASITKKANLYGRHDFQPLYSQEYVSALIADAQQQGRLACGIFDENKILHRRIAELEEQRATWASRAETLGAKLDAAEKRLATPVRLPRPACTYADHSYPAYSRKQVEEIITTAGMLFSVEGDE